MLRQERLEGVEFRTRGTRLENTTYRTSLPRVSSQSAMYEVTAPQMLNILHERPWKGRIRRLTDGAAACGQKARHGGWTGDQLQCFKLKLCE